MALTERQRNALMSAQRNNGSLFQVPETAIHHPNVLAALVRAGLLERAKVNTIWLLTEAGRAALER